MITITHAARGFCWSCRKTANEKSLTHIAVAPDEKPGWVKLWSIYIALCKDCLEQIKHES